METPEYRATHDPLTGLYNRTGIIEVLKREASRCDRTGQKVSVLIAEVDHFKNINDTHGRMVGDQIIKQLAPKMGSDLRPHDSVGRYGGEQFLVVAPNCSLSHAMAVADRLGLTVAKDKLAIGQFNGTVTVSVGVSTVKNGLETDTAVREAERALEQSKKEKDATETRSVHWGGKHDQSPDRR
jgi:diguanylate cyclase